MTNWLGRAWKRFFDLTVAIAALIVFAPMLGLIAVAIKVSSRGPVLFMQERIGWQGRKFRIIKFRSMVRNAPYIRNPDGSAYSSDTDPRVTRLGTFLRKTSIDELPQLINVLKGEMSLVGPRPLNMRDVGRFSEAWLMRRFSVKPGLTCLWQISGRSNISFDRWIALDLHYIDNWSLQMDFKILAMTLPVVIKGTGAA